MPAVSSDSTEARGPAFGPGASHVPEIVDQQVGRGLEIFPTPVAVAVRAGVTRGIVGPGAVAGARSGPVEILAPEQEFDRVISGRDIGLDVVGLVQRVCKQLRRDPARVHFLAREGEGRMRDHVHRGVFVLVGRPAIGGIDIVDETLVERPCVHLAFPVIDDRVAEAEDLRLHVGHAGLKPGGPCRLQRLGRGIGEKCIHCGTEPLCGHQTVAIGRFGDVDVGLEHLRPVGRGGGADTGNAERDAGEEGSFHEAVLSLSSA